MSDHFEPGVVGGAYTFVAFKDETSYYIRKRTQGDHYQLKNLLEETVRWPLPAQGHHLHRSSQLLRFELLAENLQ